MVRDTGGRREQGGEPIQVLGLGTALETAIAEGASNRIGPFPTGSVVRIFGSVTCRFRFGDGTVVAADAAPSCPLTAGQAEFYHMGTSTHIAAISRPGSGAGFFQGIELV